MDNVIDKTFPEWEGMYREWLQQGKPGWLQAAGGRTYQVLQPSDDDVKFKLRGGMEDFYNSSSTKGIAS